MENNDLVTITIDDKTLQVKNRTTVLEAARSAGITIPTLCHHEAVAASGACRICIVEMSVEKRGRTVSWMDASCVYPVHEGLVIKTDTPKVRKQRKLILELLLSRAPRSERLLELAAEYGAETGRFESVNQGRENCILCGLCEKVCKYSIQANVISMAFRGVKKKVTAPFQTGSSLCIGCLACYNVCPTGAIKYVIEGNRLKMPAWDADVKMQKCTECGALYAPSEYIKELKKKAPGLKKDVLSKCPACRRKIFKAGTPA
ncbi:MAG: (2Fe-2S)-binding protein [Spirochaetales bacterium]|nr:(2Fe-2S)-binding protein [Spirochaetales bacterium]